ncbi:Sir2 family NAD-dependent protein deacetylase, partial [Klebsiella pneumoniae]
MSAESGIRTFRDSNGLWENYDIQQVATPDAMYKLIHERVNYLADLRVQFYPPVI